MLEPADITTLLQDCSLDSSIQKRLYTRHTQRRKVVRDEGTILRMEQAKQSEIEAYRPHNNKM